MDIIEESASEAFEMHSSLLSKGFALEGPPNVQQALDGVIPFRFGFCVLIFLSTLSDFLSQEKLTQKLLELKAEKL
mgnify:CR=1 FL=1